MIWLLLLIVGFALSGETNPMSGLIVNRWKGATSRWVTVRNPDSGRVVFLIAREGPDGGPGYGRSECWATETGAMQRIADLLAKPYADFATPIVHPDAVGPGIDCGTAMAGRLLAESDQ